MIQIQSFTFNAFQENTYVLYDESKEAIIVDPGCYEEFERNELDTFVSNNNLNVKRLINTHCHIDHVLGNFHVCNKYGVTLEIPKGEEDILKAVSSYADVYGFPQYQPQETFTYIDLNETITIGENELEARFSPGHSPGHFIFYSSKQNFVIGGDVLFRQSIGRTDLPGGDHETLLSSIRLQLYTLPDETVVHPGHGPETTIGFEKVNNAFCTA